MLPPDDDWGPLETAQDLVDQYKVVKRRLTDAQRTEDALTRLRDIVIAEREVTEQLEALSESTALSPTSTKLRGHRKLLNGIALAAGSPSAAEKVTEAAKARVKVAQREVYGNLLVQLQTERGDLAMAAEELSATSEVELDLRLKVAGELRTEAERDHDAVCNAATTAFHSEAFSFFRHVSHPVQIVQNGWQTTEVSRAHMEAQWEGFFQATEALIALSVRTEVAPLRYEVENRLTGKWKSGEYERADVVVAKTFSISLAEAQQADPAHLLELAEKLADGNAQVKDAQRRAGARSQGLGDNAVIDVFDADAVLHLLDSERTHRQPMAPSGDELIEVLRKSAALAALETRFQQEATTLGRLIDEANAPQGLVDYMRTLPPEECRPRTEKEIAAGKFLGLGVAEHELEKSYGPAQAAEEALTVRGLASPELANQAYGAAATRAALASSGVAQAEQQINVLLGQEQYSYVRSSLGQAVDAAALAKALPLLQLRLSSGSQSDDYLLDAKPDTMSVRQFTVAIVRAVEDSGVDIDKARIMSPKLSESILGGELMTGVVSAKLERRAVTIS